jgi:hypothetical protein
MRYLGYKARFKLGDECKTMLGRPSGSTSSDPDYSQYIPDDLALAALAAVEEYLIEIGAIDPPEDGEND